MTFWVGWEFVLKGVHKIQFTGQWVFSACIFKMAVGLRIKSTQSFLGVYARAAFGLLLYLASDKSKVVYFYLQKTTHQGEVMGIS